MLQIREKSFTHEQHCGSAAPGGDTAACPDYSAKSAPVCPTIRRSADVVGAGSSAGTFSRRATEAALMALVTRYRGVHHQLVLDVPQAAAFVVRLTKALAQQPYRSQVGWSPCLLEAPPLTTRWPLLRHELCTSCIPSMGGSFGTRSRQPVLQPLFCVLRPAAGL